MAGGGAIAAYNSAGQLDVGSNRVWDHAGLVKGVLAELDVSEPVRNVFNANVQRQGAGHLGYESLEA